MLRKVRPLALLIAFALLPSDAAAVSDFKAAIRFGEAPSWALAVAGSPNIATSEGIYFNSTNHHMIHHMPDGTDVDITLLAQAAAGTLAGYVAVNNNNGLNLTSRTVLELAPRLTGADSAAHHSTVLDLATTGVSAGTYAAGAITVDAYGRVLSANAGTTAVSPGIYTNASVTVDAYGRVTAASSGTGVIAGLTNGRIPQASTATSLIDTPISFTSATANGGTTDNIGTGNVAIGMSAIGIGGTCQLIAMGGGGLVTSQGARINCSGSTQRAEMEFSPSGVNGYRLRLENNAGSLTGNYPEWQFYNYNSNSPIIPFGISNTLIYAAVAVRAGALIESTSGGFKFPDGTIQTTAGATTATLTSGRIPVATGAGALGNSGLTFAGSTLDATTATLTFGGTMTALQWVAGATRTINVAAGAVDTAGSQLTITGGDGGAASAVAAGAGAPLQLQGGAGGAGSATLAGATGAAINLRGGIGGANGGVGGGVGGAVSIVSGGGRTGTAGTAGIAGGTGSAAGAVAISAGTSGPGGAGGANANGGNGAAGPAWSWSGGKGGDGGAGNGTGNGGNGGAGGTFAFQCGGSGGAAGAGGAAGGTSGAGGSCTLTSGNAGSASGGTGANSGDLSIDPGTPSGSGVAGTVKICTNRGACTLGANGSAVTITGEVQTPIPGKVGTAIASATTIAPTSMITHITGTTQVNTITAPTALAQSGGGGCIYLVPDAAFTTGTTGNIAIASTAVVGRLMIDCYDNATAKWYPNY